MDRSENDGLDINELSPENGHYLKNIFFRLRETTPPAAKGQKRTMSEERWKFRTFLRKTLVGFFNLKRPDWTGNKSGGIRSLYSL